MSEFFKKITIINEDGVAIDIDVFVSKKPLLSGKSSNPKSYFISGTKQAISKRSIDGLFIVPGYDSLFKTI